MAALPESCATAIANVRRFIASDRRYPRNVFVGEWTDFFFFDSDWILDAGFVQSVIALLDAEGGRCACLLRLESAASDGALLIDRQTTPRAYQELLKGEGPGSGWVYEIARYACASDGGEWCIYCEQASEIAVIAFRRPNAATQYASTIADFHAARLSEAISEPLSYGFSDRALTQEWRDELLRQYPGTR